MSFKQLVAIIGAGMSGLVAAKELLDEGHDVTIFEREAVLGGNFSTGAAYERMKLTVSNYFMAFSSLPPPPGQERRFWTRDEYVEYLNRFATTFDIARHIRFNTNVITARRLDDTTFQVVYDTERGQAEDEKFSALAVCRGSHRIEAPAIVSFPGMKDFSGEIFHAAAWKGPERFAGKRVVCVGMGETSADITREISDVAEACWLSMRSYPALITRYYDGHTNDAYSARIAHWTPRAQLSRSRREIEETIAYRLSPQDRIVFEWSKKAKPGKFYQKNCDFLDNVVAQKIQPIFSGISHLAGNTVHFEDGTSVDADAIMLCTGFQENSIPDAWIEGYSVTDIRQLYKHEFHPDLGWRVAFIGWARPLHGGVPAASEMQSRLFALMCSGTKTLPPRQELARLIQADAEYEDELTSGSRHIRTLVHYTQYMDAMADLIGCKPALGEYLDDPEFLYKLLFGSNIGACYRLTGPHSEPEAARALIMSLPVAAEDSYVYSRLLPKIAPLSLRTQVDESLADRVEAAVAPFLHAEGNGSDSVYLDT
jgi:dimethylaniline monooxygenase (N-oxide forming)